MRKWEKALDLHFEARGVINTFWRPGHLARPRTLAEVQSLITEYEQGKGETALMVMLPELDRCRPKDSDGKFVAIDVWHRPTVASTFGVAAPSIYTVNQSYYEKWGSRPNRDVRSQ